MVLKEASGFAPTTCHLHTLGPLIFCRPGNTGDDDVPISGLLIFIAIYSICMKHDNQMFTCTAWLGLPQISVFGAIFNLSITHDFIP